MDLTTWLRRYLTTHPLKGPEDIDRSQYTAEVMTRVRELAPPPTRPVASGALRRWVQQWRLGQQPWVRVAELVGGWPQFALATVAAAAVVLVIVGRSPDPHLTVAQDVEQELELLASLDEPFTEPLEPAELAEELEALDAVVLAEAQPGDEAWVLETLQLLDEVEEAPPEADVDEGGDDQWLQDLQLLDDLELTTAS